MPGRHSRLIFLVAFALSLGVHIVLLGYVPLPPHAAGHQWQEQEFSIYLEPPPPPPEEHKDVIEQAPAPPPEPEVLLGLNAPLPPSLNWLGFPDYVPQQAPLAATEQAAFTDEPIAAAPRESTAHIEPVPAPPVDQPPDEPTLQNRPPSPNDAITPVEEKPEPSPTPMQTPAPESDAQPQESPPEKTEEHQAEGSSPQPFSSMLVDLLDQMLQQQAAEAIPHETALIKGERPTEEASPDAMDKQSREAQSANRPASASPPASQPAPPAAAPPSNKPVAPQPTPGASNQGIPSDKHSQPTSVIEVPREHWQLGRPLAGKGLELKPRRPTFTLLTLLTAAPGNPLCEMSFDRDGVVKSAKILKSSGDSRIDEGILNSLYYWRAAGEELEKLQPGEVLVIQMRIMLTRRSG